jgi:hypothetical protein
MAMEIMDAEERQMVDYIWNLIPAEDKAGKTVDDILDVLDAMDDYLEQVGLLEVDNATCEMTYLDGEVDETEQLEFISKKLPNVSKVWIQLIIDAELQYGIKQGYYSEE